MFVRPFSVIPAKAGIHVHRNETAEAAPEFSKAGGSAEGRGNAFNPCRLLTSPGQPL
jgi:hypothetical protein